MASIVHTSHVSFRLLVVGWKRQSDSEDIYFNQFMRAVCEARDAKANTPVFIFFIETVFIHSTVALTGPVDLMRYSLPVLPDLHEAPSSAGKRRPRIATQTSSELNHSPVKKSQQRDRKQDPIKGHVVLLLAWRDWRSLNTGHHLSR